MSGDRFRESRWVDGAQLHALSLQFADRAFEQRFERHRLRETLNAHRVWGAAAVACFMLLGLLEYFLLPDLFARAAIVRYGIGAPVLLAFYFCTVRVDLFPQQSSVRGFALLFVHSVTLYLFLTTPYPDNDLYFLQAVLAFVFMHGSTFLRFVYTGIISWLAFTGYTVAILWQGSMPPAVLLMHVTILFFIALAGFFSHYNNEIGLRRAYRSREALRRQVRRSVALARNAEASNAAKSNFLTMMSHELRTPLNAIIGFAEMIRQQLLGPIGNDSYREYVADIERSGRHLLRVIDDILDISQAQAGRLKLNDEELDVEEVVDAALSLTRRYVGDGGAAAVVDVDPQLPKLRADGLKLRQILVNLISNAHRATPDDGEICITGACDDGGGIRISVCDNGCGMPPQLMASEPFAERGDQTIRQQEGLGLGLPLVRALAGLHDANVLIDSTLGEGTTVTLALPPARTIVPRGPLRAISSTG